MLISSEIRRDVLKLLAEGYSYNYISKKFKLTKTRILQVEEDDFKVFSPAYDPCRDGMRSYDSITAAILGDPPIGRRALDNLG